MIRRAQFLLSIPRWISPDQYAGGNLSNEINYNVHNSTLLLMDPSIIYMKGHILDNSKSIVCMGIKDAYFHRGVISITRGKL